MVMNSKQNRTALRCICRQKTTERHCRSIIRQYLENHGLFASKIRPHDRYIPDCLSRKAFLSLARTANSYYRIRKFHPSIRCSPCQSYHTRRKYRRRLLAQDKDLTERFGFFPVDVFPRLHSTPPSTGIFRPWYEQDDNSDFGRIHCAPLSFFSDHSDIADDVPSDAFVDTFLHVDMSAENEVLVHRAPTSTTP